LDSCSLIYFKVALLSVFLITALLSTLAGICTLRLVAHRLLRETLKIKVLP
jgi:hypothetical protein